MGDGRRAHAFARPALPKGGGSRAPRMCALCVVSVRAAQCHALSPALYSACRLQASIVQVRPRGVMALWRCSVWTCSVARRRRALSVDFCACCAWLPFQRTMQQRRVRGYTRAAGVSGRAGQHMSAGPVKACTACVRGCKRGVAAAAAGRASQPRCARAVFRRGLAGTGWRSPEQSCPIRSCRVLNVAFMSNCA